MTLEASNIAALLRRIAGVRLLVLGDFMLDRTIYGEASRISPEAPTPVVLFQHSREELGGAGNVTRNLDSLGAHISCVAVVGDDPAGAAIEGHLNSLRGCENALVLREPGRTTTVKTRVAAVQTGRAGAAGSLYGHQQMLRLDEESRHPLAAPAQQQVMAFAATAIKEVQAVVISDYAKGALPPELLRRIISLAQGEGKPVFVDPKARDFSRYHGSTVLTPNALEAEAALALPLAGAAQPADPGWEDAAQQHLTGWNLQALLVTRGAEGVTLIERDSVHHFPTAAREVFDVTGAGDTVLAAFSLASAAGASFSEAAQFSNLAAGVVVSKAGAAAVHPFEIERELESRHFSAGAKLRTPAEMRDIADILRRERKTIVFTNGCFDLLHAGHIYLLREAKKFGDILVVALNSDTSVRRLKGDSRPVVGEQDRAEALASLESVDYLIVFEEQDPMELLRAIRPNVLVKGDDYQESEVVGADFLKSYGGQVRLVPVRRGISTTRLVETIRAGRSASQES